jgi:hypothetical protein
MFNPLTFMTLSLCGLFGAPPAPLICVGEFSRGGVVLCNATVRTYEGSSATITCELSNPGRIIDLKTSPRVNSDGTISERLEIRIKKPEDESKDQTIVKEVLTLRYAIGKEPLFSMQNDCIFRFEQVENGYTRVCLNNPDLNSKLPTIQPGLPTGQPNEVMISLHIKPADEPKP